MDDLQCQQFFREPRQSQQRRYDALRAFFLDRRPLPDIAQQFGFAHGTLRNLVSQFRAQCQAGAVPPFSSFSIMCFPSCSMTQSLPPSTVVSSAVPLPSRIFFNRSEELKRPITT